MNSERETPRSRAARESSRSHSESSAMVVLFRGTPKEAISFDEAAQSSRHSATRNQAILCPAEGSGRNASPDMAAAGLEWCLKTAHAARHG